MAQDLNQVPLPRKCQVLSFIAPLVIHRRRRICSGIASESMDNNTSAINRTPVSLERNKRGAAPQPVRQACEVCRDRKVRCDRALPICGRCNRLKQPCGYGNRAVSSRHNLPDQIQQLQDRLAKAEALLALPSNSAIATPAEIFSSPTMLNLDVVGPFGPLQPHVPSIPSALTLSPGMSIGTDEVLKGPASTTFDMQTAAIPMPDNLGDCVNFTSADGNSPGSALDWAILPVSPLEPIMTISGDSALDTSFPSNNLSTVGWDEQIPAKDLTLLHQEYFDIIYYSLPFLSKQRFDLELSQTPSSPAFLALKYALALMGSTLSSNYLHFQATCYHTARNCIERCEREGEESNLGSLNLFQALLFIIRFEIMDRKLSRAWITVGRAVRMSKMLNLHQMDRDPAERKAPLDIRMNLSAPDDPLLLEECRRSFWGLYILESYLRTRTGMECELGSAETFDVYLPSPGLLHSALSPVNMSFLRNFKAETCIDISSYAGCILMVELAIRCLDHGKEFEARKENQSFWDDHYALIKMIDELMATLQTHINADAISEDPVAFSTYMNLRATEILFHEAAIAQLDRQGLSVLMAAESQKRSSAAAYKIASAVQLNWPSTAQSRRDIFYLQATFIAWPLVLAMKAMERDLLHPSNKDAHGIGGIIASLKLLVAALDHIEESDGYWHKSIAPVLATLKQWDEKNGFTSLIL